jgi:acyl carrier protein
MDKLEFIKNFREQFDETDESLILAHTDFKSLEEWSSLLALSVIAMVDDIYQVEIGAKEIVKCDTIEELYELAKSLKQSE